MASMIILTIVAAFLALLLIGAVAFTLVGLRRRRRARDAATRGVRPPDDGPPAPN